MVVTVERRAKRQGSHVTKKQFSKRVSRESRNPDDQQMISYSNLWPLLKYFLDIQREVSASLQ